MRLSRTHRYLLGVQRPEKSDEMSLGKRMEQEYLELERAWTGPRSETRQIDLRRRIALEVRRHRADEPFFQDARTQQRLER